eukprot:Em0003g526a
MEETSVHDAARSRNAEVVNALLKAGSKVDENDQMGKTPLHDAARSGNAEVVNALLKAGSKVDEKDEVLGMVGTRERASAFALEDPRRYLIVKSNSCNASAQRHSLPSMTNPMSNDTVLSLSMDPYQDHGNCQYPECRSSLRALWILRAVLNLVWQRQWILISPDFFATYTAGASHGLLLTLMILRSSISVELDGQLLVCRNVFLGLQKRSGCAGALATIRYRFRTAVVYSCEQYDQAGRNCNTSPVAGDSPLICGPFDDT